MSKTSKIIKHLILFVLLIFAVTRLADAKLNEIVCKSTTVRSVEDFNQLQNCTIVAGHVRLVQMQFSRDLIEQVQFSNIEEITGYLLVYRVEGLESLEVLFPKLIVIRGVELLYDQYALVVMENRELRDIGLVSLLRILKGSIRIESNPSLCFTDTIDWVAILGDNTTKKYTYVIKHNKPSMQCPSCYTQQNENDLINENLPKYCWSVGKQQLYTTDFNNGRKKCSSSCLTSCSEKNCRHCINYVKDEGCINECLPSKYKLAYKRQCVTDCSSLGLITFGSECIEKCPKHNREVTQNGIVTCVINCTGNFKVNNINDLEGFSDCSTLNGSLTIELYETNKPIINHLQKAFLNINEITGYLRILRSTQITSLNFFQNLHTIRGSELIENLYSLYVVDNHHLEELWTKNQNVAIIHGRVFFHLNPILCYSNILELQKNLKESPKISITDASRNSNGERVVCGDLVRVLSANVTDFNSNSALIVHDLLDNDFLNLIIAYIYYYKEAPERNVTSYDGRHGCGQDEWFMDVTQSKQRRHILKNLKPATQYAYFVKTMTLLDYHYQSEAISDIDYFQTLPTKPGAVAKFFSYSSLTDEIDVFWWPPRQPNGVIEKYLLKYELTNLTMLKNAESFTANREELCMCPNLDSHLSGGTPDVEKYYIKEEVIYADALYDYILIKNESKAHATEETQQSATNETIENNNLEKNATNESKSHATNEIDHSQMNVTEEIQQSATNETIENDNLETNETNLVDTVKSSYIDIDDIVQMTLDKHQKRANRIQDLNKENFVIVHPYPICNRTNATTQYQTENNCISLDSYENTIKVPPQRYTYKFSKLKAERIYRFSIRACVANLANGCGPEKVIWAQTVSKRMEKLLKSIKYTKISN